MIPKNSDTFISIETKLNIEIFGEFIYFQWNFYLDNPGWFLIELKHSRSIRKKNWMLYNSISCINFRENRFLFIFLNFIFLIFKSFWVFLR